jgi:hypothetical protein
MSQSNQILEYIEYLELKRPINITLKTRRKKKAEAEYWPSFSDKKGLLTHNIVIYNICDNTRELNALIIHELIHAWQEEQKLTEIHGKHFKRMARKASRRFNIPNIYIKESDK